MSARQRPANSSAGVFYIAFSTRDNVYMQVANRLSRGSAFIDPDIKAVRAVALPDDCLNLLKELHKGLYFFAGSFVNSQDMAPGDN